MRAEIERLQKMIKAGTYKEPEIWRNELVSEAVDGLSISPSPRFARSVLDMSSPNIVQNSLNQGSSVEPFKAPFNNKEIGLEDNKESPSRTLTPDTAGQQMSWKQRQKMLK